MTPSFVQWTPNALVAITFTTLGCLKIYGRRRGIMGGGDKPWTQRCLGSCPTWSRQANIAVILFFLGIGLVEFLWAVSYFVSW